MLGKCEFYRFVILLSLVACSGGQRFSRRAGDQADEGKCLSLNWGGLTGLHWYTCCNNCNSQDTSCDGKTYHGASDGVYCDACGTDNKAGDGKIREDFSCGGCTGQEQILNKCRSKLGILFKTVGFCWAFTWCFEHHCKKQYMQGVTPKDTAFDLVCNEGETVEDSPFDCCQTVNDACKQNAWVNGKCPPKCCGEPGCCRTSSGTKTMSTFAVLLNMTFVALALAIEF